MHSHRQWKVRGIHCLVCEVAIESFAAHCYGVELSPTRHAMAEQVPGWIMESVIGGITEPGKGTRVSVVSYWLDHGAREGDTGLQPVIG